MFDPCKDLLNALNAFGGIQQVRGSAVLQKGQRRGKPVCRFMFVTEDSHSMRHNRNDAGDRQLGSNQFLYSFSKTS